jgi:hypothetical protein
MRSLGINRWCLTVATRYDCIEMVYVNVPKDLF